MRLHFLNLDRGKPASSYDFFGRSKHTESLYKARSGDDVQYTGVDQMML